MTANFDWNRGRLSSMSNYAILYNVTYLSQNSQISKGPLYQDISLLIKNMNANL